MGNIILDVSNVQYIHISTKNDKIIVELDKHQENVFSVLQKVSSIDSIVNAILLFGKILNITP
jgi:nitrate reductase NapAB chaperone NapD